jgi:hypothetical protein
MLVGAAASTETIRYGATMMFQLNTAYAAYEEEFDYRPGNQFAVSVSAEKAGQRTTLVGDVTFTTFSTDVVEDQNVFKQSDNLDLHIGGQYTGESYFLTADGRYLIRGRNKRYDDNIVFEQLKVYGNEFSIDSRFGYSLNEASYIGPLMEVRLIAGNEYEFGSSNTIGFGAMYGRRFSNYGQLDVTFKYFTGGADDGRLDLSGYRFTIGLALGF